MIKITNEILDSVTEFKKNLQQYKEGSLIEFKPFSAFMGIYTERSKGTFMIRPRIPGGVITLPQLRAICDIAKKYQCNVRFTTRQDIQFHSVKIEYLGDILDELIKAGLTSKGAGGNTVRNIACSPLSGVAINEVFDVTEYVEKITNHLLIDPNNLSLPRKFKVSFSNNEEDTANATIADIGFIAKIVDGKKGFEVYSGGGLGGGATVSIKLEDFIEDSEALYYVQAMKQVFENEGDRTNRHKARLRFVLKKYGEDKFKDLFKAELNKLRKEQDLKLVIENDTDITKEINQGNEFKLSKDYKDIVFPQKQTGLYSIYVHPKCGHIQTDELDKLLTFLDSLDYQVSVRLTLTQGFFVRDIREENVHDLLNIILKFSSKFNIDNSISCVGAATCNLGLNNSQGLLDAIVEEFKESPYNIKTELPRIFISGCPNSCGQHQRGIIGFSGRVKSTADGLIPAYTIYFNGRLGSNKAKLAEAFGDIPSRKIPKFLLELATLKSNSNYEDFVEFFENNKDSIKELINDFSSLESFEINPDLYYDFDSNEKYALKK